MSYAHTDRFVRLPSQLLDNLLRLPLNGVEWRIVFWVIRQTIGWNRAATTFSWYRIAKDLKLDRAGVYRAGNWLCGAGVLGTQDGRIWVGEASGQWRTFSRGRQRAPAAMTSVNVDGNLRKRRHPSTSARRAKDRSKDRKTLQAQGTYHPAGAARPAPGKYAAFSQA